MENEMTMMMLSLLLTRELKRVRERELGGREQENERECKLSLALPLPACGLWVRKIGSDQISSTNNSQQALSCPQIRRRRLATPCLSLFFSSPAFHFNNKRYIHPTRSRHQRAQRERRAESERNCSTKPRTRQRRASLLVSHYPIPSQSEGPVRVRGAFTTPSYSP